MKILSPHTVYELSACSRLIKNLQPMLLGISSKSLISQFFPAITEVSVREVSGQKRKVIDTLVFKNVLAFARVNLSVAADRL